MQFNSTLEKNQARGLKACISNPRVSATAKQNAQEKLDRMTRQIEHHSNGKTTSMRRESDSPPSGLHVRIQDPPATVIPGYAGGQNNALDEIEMAVQQGKDEENVVRGYKAVLKNPRASDEAREHAGKVLESHELS